MDVESEFEYLIDYEEFRRVRSRAVLELSTGLTRCEFGDILQCLVCGLDNSDLLVRFGVRFPDESQNKPVWWWICRNCETRWLDIQFRVPDSPPLERRAGNHIELPPPGYQG